MCMLLQYFEYTKTFEISKLTRDTSPLKQSFANMYTYTHACIHIYNYSNIKNKLLLQNESLIWVSLTRAIIVT